MIKKLAFRFVTQKEIRKDKGERAFNYNCRQKIHLKFPYIGWQKDTIELMGLHHPENKADIKKIN